MRAALEAARRAGRRAAGASSGRASRSRNALMASCDLTIATGGPAMVQGRLQLRQAGLRRRRRQRDDGDRRDRERRGSGAQHAHQQDQRQRLRLLRRRQPDRRFAHLRRASSRSCRRKAATSSTTTRRRSCRRPTGTPTDAAPPTPSRAARRRREQGRHRPARRQDVLHRARAADRQGASLLDREARRRARDLQVPRLGHGARHGAADLRDRRPRPLVRHLLVRRRAHPPAGADGAGQPHHGAAGAVELERRHVHQRHADDVEHGLRRVGRQHHEREHLAEALHERHLGEPADCGGPPVRAGAVRRVLQLGSLRTTREDTHEHSHPRHSRAAADDERERASRRICSRTTSSGSASRSSSA